MMVQDHVQTAQGFLEAADAEFAAGDNLQASEKMWGAASHAVIAVALQRDWKYGSHRDLKNVAERLAVEHQEPLLASDFMAAEKYHRNFYHNFMEDFELYGDQYKVRRFVARMTEIAGD